MTAKKIDKTTLLCLLDRIRDAVEHDDSFEGRLYYTTLDERCGRAEFMVDAFIRVGNSEGQGGSIVVGETEHEDDNQCQRGPLGSDSRRDL